MNSIKFLVLDGPSARPYASEIGQLRIKVFRDFPYLYEGTLDYEREYLETYFKSTQSIIALCFDEERIVGCSTAISLLEESDSIVDTFKRKKLNLEDYVYFGESILEKKYRGMGIGKEFFKIRKDFALNKTQAQYAVFCAVVREENDPFKPTDYAPLNTFWQTQGFEQWTDMKCSLSWTQIGMEHETTHTLQFWKHQLRK